MSADESRLLTTIEAVRRLDASLTQLDGVIVSAVLLGFADDTRSLAKLFDIEHAFVIRAVNGLAGAEAWLDIVGREARTQRSRIALNAAGRSRLAAMPQDSGRP